MTHPAVIERRRRVQRIRARVAAGAAALFIALFGGLYVRMASGDDPALSASSAQVASAATTASGGSTTTSSPSSGSSGSDTATASSPMTTQAS